VASIDGNHSVISWRIGVGLRIENSKRFHVDLSN
jgi:hypothetical protein